MSGREQREAARDNMRQAEMEDLDRALFTHYDCVVGIGRAKQLLRGGLRDKLDMVVVAIRTRADRLVAVMRKELEERIEKFNALAESVVTMQTTFDAERSALHVSIEGLRQTIMVQHEELATQEGLLRESRELARGRGDTIKTLERRMASKFHDESAAVNALRREVGEKEAMIQYGDKIIVGLKEEVERLTKLATEAVQLAQRQQEAVKEYMEETGAETGTQQPLPLSEEYR